MSGGHFDYVQHRIDSAADEILRLIENNSVKDKWGSAANYPPDIIERFHDTILVLNRGAAMLHRIDYLVSGDDGEDSFRRRWIESVPKIKRRRKK